MRNMRKLSDYAIAGGLGTLLATGLTGCFGGGDETTQEDSKPKGAFVIIEEVEKGKYKVKDEYPSDETRIVLKQLDGVERVLTQDEMNKLIYDEAAKIENNTSNLTNPNSANVGNQGMSLGETLLASAAGAMLGAWIGNKLFGNQNYQNNRQAGYKSPQTYSKSTNSFSRPSTTTSSTRSGFFGNKSTSSSSSSSYGG